MSRRWLVDGMNVIGSRPTGWWRDRPRAMAELLEELREFALRTGDEVTVVYDGRERELAAEAGAVRVGFAPGGRNAADDEIARRVAEDGEPSAITVVTSDGELAARARDAGAEVMGAGAFRRQLEGADGSA